MSVARRPLLTAVAAGTLLCALWFVPSAKTAGEQSPVDDSGSSVADMADLTSMSGSAGTAGAADVDDDENTDADTDADTAEEPERLSRAIGTDITPYVLAGTILLGVGAGSVTLATRRFGGPRT
ncbi:hypothetical protein AB0C52_18370 [Streptomyces sp. NPDC048717]|uniref:hypothetical protein n=1 Tax=Streptomyces sp. NPDC048717 TaxID=3154928 RepID=UPI003415C766